MTAVAPVAALALLAADPVEFVVLLAPPELGVGAELVVLLELLAGAVDVELAAVVVVLVVLLGVSPVVLIGPFAIVDCPPQAVNVVNAAQMQPKIKLERIFDPHAEWR